VIHYHGTPITPLTAAAKVLRGKHAFISFARPEQLDVALEVCQSFAVDCGAFSAWRSGAEVSWPKYYDWVKGLLRVPNFDWAIIPDVIDGNEADNDALAAEWPHGSVGVPVWHMHESLDRLTRLATDWPRVALGSSGDYSRVGSREWWDRITKAMHAICDGDGLPAAKLHGLRMLNPEVFSRLPFASADSCNVARNIGIDSKWNGGYAPPTKEWRAVVLSERIEQFNAAQRWSVPDECEPVVELPQHPTLFDFGRIDRMDEEVRVLPGVSRRADSRP
jgi:hypothetical protein